MAFHIFMDSLRPIFEAVEGVDFGPGTARPIRYSMGQYAQMVARYFEHPGSMGTFSPVDYISGNVRLDDGNVVFVQASGLMARVNPMAWEGSFTFLSDSDFESAEDFPSCPLLEGEPEGGTHETASIAHQAFETMGMTFSMLTPAMVQASWKEAQDASGGAAAVWLPFSLLIPDGGWQQVYTCEVTHATGELDGGTLASSFLGIDYGDGSPLALGDYDLRVPLGDGTTFAYFKDPGGPAILIDTITTTDGIS